jgi:hypothetical protein
MIAGDLACHRFNGLLDHVAIRWAEVDAKTAASMLGAFIAQSSLISFAQFSGQIKTEASALGLCGIERLKQRGSDLRCHSGAIINDVEIGLGVI